MKGILFLVGFILWLWAMIDIIKSQFEDKNMKVVWILLVLFLPVVGTVIYLLYGERTKIIPVGRDEQNVQIIEIDEDQNKDSNRPDTNEPL